MATESSAIARFVNQAQSHAIHDPYARPGIVDITQAVPPMSAQGPVPAAPLPPPRGPANASRGGGGLWLGLIGFVVIGGAVAGGYLLAQQQSGAPESEVTDAIGANAALAADEEPGQVAAVQGEPEEPLAGAERTVAPDAAEDTINPDSDPALAAREAIEAGGLDLELAKKTGFDILVEPAGAKVSLDGHNIGIAPLRVRNLLPGVHGIDIEGPTGFFGKHLEFELEAGQAQVIELELVAIESGDGAKPGKAVSLAPDVEPIESAAAEKSTERDQKKSASNSKSSKDNRKGKTKSSSKRMTKAQERAARKASAAKSKKAMADADEVSLGTLMLGAKPPCEIVIDGKNTGLTTPQRSIQLPEGTHRVVLVNDEHGIKKSFKVNIKAGRTTRAIQDLTKKL